MVLLLSFLWLLFGCAVLLTAAVVALLFVVDSMPLAVMVMLVTPARGCRPLPTLMADCLLPFVTAYVAECADGLWVVLLVKLLPLDLVLLV